MYSFPELISIKVLLFDSIIKDQTTLNSRDTI
jgi:hypothetical protein